MNLGMLLRFSEPQWSHLKMGIIIGTFNIYNWL